MRSPALSDNDPTSFLDLQEYPHISSSSPSSTLPSSSAQWAPDRHGASPTRPVVVRRRLLPKPPSLASSMPQPKPAFGPAIPEARPDPPPVTSLLRSMPSSQSIGSSSASHSNTKSFFQPPSPPQNRSHPYAFSSSDVATTLDTRSEQIRSRPCVIDAEADRRNQAMVAHNCSDHLPDAQLSNLDSTDGARRRKQRSVFLPLPKSKYKQNDVFIPKIPFDEHEMPTDWQLSLAASLYVFDENSTRVRFGDVWERQRTVVCFIRHFWSVFYHSISVSFF
jgi:hypothetical protein